MPLWCVCVCIIVFFFKYTFHIHTHTKKNTREVFNNKSSIVRAPARAVYTAVISDTCTFLRGKCEKFPRNSWVVRLLAGALIVRETLVEHPGLSMLEF